VLVGRHDADSDTTEPAGAKAVAEIEPTSPASTVRGTVEFADEEAVTIVTINLSGATPGVHAMHIHQNQSCAAVDGGGGLGAGGHWNPADAAHGFPTAPVHHLGDLGNVTADKDGNVTATVTSEEFYVGDGPNTIMGHAVIFHEKPDDGSQPVGNAGARPGCGIIVPADEGTQAVSR